MATGGGQSRSSLPCSGGLCQCSEACHAGSLRVNDIVVPRTVQKVHRRKTSCTRVAAIVEQVLGSRITFRAVKVDDTRRHPKAGRERCNLQMVRLGGHGVYLLRAELRNRGVRREEGLIVVLVQLQMRGRQYSHPAHEVAIALLQHLLHVRHRGAFHGELHEASHELFVEVFHGDLLIARLHARIEEVLGSCREGGKPLLAPQELLEDAKEVGAIEAVAVWTCPAKSHETALKRQHLRQEPRILCILHLERVERDLWAHQRHGLRRLPHLALVRLDLVIPRPAVGRRRGPLHGRRSRAVRPCSWQWLAGAPSEA
mmetsp:Transcript_29751/g.85176  ORF Transcript_29751/g.85176 Transcript_29751/m.85176 type:complete len:314 (+) Transcript_29751:80-1021(+)